MNDITFANSASLIAKVAFIVPRCWQNTYDVTEVIDDAAIEVAKKSKFGPAMVRGLHKDGWIFMKLEFKLPDD